MSDSNMSPQEQLTKLLNDSFPNPVERQLVIEILKKYKQLFLLNEQQQNQ